MCAAVSAEALNATMAGLNQNFQNLMVMKDMHQKEKLMQARLKAHEKLIPHCDGRFPSETRSWLQDVEVALSSLHDIPGSAAHVAMWSSHGDLHKEIHEFIKTKPDELKITWEEVQSFVTDAFVSKNEGEKLRSQLDCISQKASENVMTFNRRFRHLAEQAYPEPSPDTEKFLVKLYVPALRNRSFGKKVVMNDKCTTLAAAMELVEKQDAGHELFDSFVARADPRNIQPMEVNAMNAEDNPLSETGISSLVEELKSFKQAHLKQSSTLNNRIAKLETQTQSSGGYDHGNNGSQHSMHLPDQSQQFAPTQPGMYPDAIDPGMCTYSSQNVGYIASNPSPPFWRNPREFANSEYNQSHSRGHYSFQGRRQGFSNEAPGQQNLNQREFQQNRDNQLDLRRPSSRKPTNAGMRYTSPPHVAHERQQGRTFDETAWRRGPGWDRGDNGPRPQYGNYGDQKNRMTFQTQPSRTGTDQRNAGNTRRNFKQQTAAVDDGDLQPNPDQQIPLNY